MSITNSPDPSETASTGESRRSWRKWGAAGLLWATFILRGLSSDLNAVSTVRSLVLFGMGMLGGKLLFRKSRTRVVVFWVSAIVLLEAAFGFAVHLYTRSATRRLLASSHGSATELPVDASGDSWGGVLRNDIRTYRLTTESLTKRIASVTSRKSLFVVSSNIAVLQRTVSYHDSFAKAHLAHWSMFRATASPELHQTIDSLAGTLERYYAVGHQALVLQSQTMQFLQQYSDYWGVENEQLVWDDADAMEQCIGMVAKSESLTALEDSLKTASLFLIYRALP